MGDREESGDEDNGLVIGLYVGLGEWGFLFGLGWAG